MKITEPNWSEPDETYADLIAAHEGLSPEESAALNVRLILTLANIVGDRDKIAEAIAIAKAAK